jgi:hypothetical protein
MLSRGIKKIGGISSIAVITGSVFSATQPKVLLEAINAPVTFHYASEADAALPFLVTPTPIEILVESLINNRLLLLTKMECDLTMRESSLVDLTSRIHMLKLNMMLNPIRSDFSQLIEQHNELVKLRRRELSQHQKKHAEYEMLTGQIYSLLRLYRERQEE